MNAPAAPLPFRESFTLSAEGLRLYRREYGERETTRVPVLCLTGLTRNCKDYHFLARRLAAQRRVLCPDYRGRGRSEYDPDWTRYRIERYADDMGRILADAAIDKVVVIGTSLGGLVAMAMAAVMPERLAGVVLNDVGPEIDMSGVTRIIDYISADRPQPDWESAARDVRLMLPGLVLPSEDAWIAMARSTFRAGEDGLLHFDWDVNLAKPLMAGEPMPDLWPMFAALAGVPVLVLRGETSDVLSAATVDRMAQVKPDLMRVTVPGVGHAPHLGEPVSLAALDAFLTGV